MELYQLLMGEHKLFPDLLFVLFLYMSADSVSTFKTCGPRDTGLRVYACHLHFMFYN